MNSTVFEMIIRVFGAFLSIYSFAVLLQVPRRFVLQAGIVEQLVDLFICLQYILAEEI